MIEYNIVKIENSDSNKIIIKHISLDHKLDFFMAIDSNKKDFASIIENKILDFIIDKISSNNTYKDFSNALEKINKIIKTYKENNNTQEIYLNILISVLNKNDFIFSNIWKSSLYLIKDTNETIEITDKNENKKEFNYIFEWNLDNWDILIMSPSRLLEYLSYSDFTDSAVLWKIEKINKNIELIISWENLNKNIWTLAIKYWHERQIPTKNKAIIEKINKFSLKLMDNNFIKITIAYFNIIKEKIEKKSKTVKSLLLVAGIIVATILLFQILSKTIWTITINDNTIEYQEQLELARKYKSIASDNYTNSEVFNQNIRASEEIIYKMKDEKIFIDDIKILEEQLNIIKKTFNKVERWEQWDKHLIYKVEDEYKNDLVKVLEIDLKINKKIYLITKKAIIWPILNTDTPTIHKFDELIDDEFVDAVELKGTIILLTKSWKIVEFRKSWNFLFKDVSWQETWQEAKSIESYASNIYLVWWEINQIYKHEKGLNNFRKWIPYLKEEDKKAHKILDIAIDWWFYILKNDLSIIKFFSSPYRIENITINNLPENYNRIPWSKVKIIARQDLNYVYMLLNNKIWIFKPNSKFYKQTKSLNYLWQIESNSEKINDFFIEKDGTIIISNKNWVYNISFNENDGKIIVNN